MEINWAFALLKSDPFLIEAPADTQGAVWADMGKMRKHFEQIISTSLFSGVTQVIFNRGDWGAGKTHAARYFTIEDHVRVVPFDGWIRCIYTETPRDPDQAVQVFYERMLEELRWDSIRQWVREVHEAFGEEKAYERFFSITRDSDLARIVWLLGKRKPEYNKYWLRKYLIGRPTAKELSALELTRSMRPRDAHQRVAVLAAILKAAMGFKDQPTGRLFIWIDETEDLNLYASVRREFLTGLWRDLVDSMPRGLTLFLNYTPRAGERVDVRGIFGEALVSRFTDTLSFEQLDEKESFIYVSDLLNCPIYRERDPVSLNLPATYPFPQEMLKWVLSRVKPRTPRNINLACGRLLRSALQEGVIQGIGKGTIDMNYIEQKWAEVEQLLKQEKALVE
ncbi:MAG: hypothetical protein DDT32_00959 [Syntrophomonadaceae bacterium]|nr:hypothetical protein [Bacillota bacterium]MBT9147207.1 hypothetical protein [Bacillota bacterium]